jgi:ankyrin repeat protein
MKKCIGLVLSIVFLGIASCIQSMERPPKREARNTKQPQKKPRVSRAVMPEFNEGVASEHRALLEAAARGDLEYLRQHLPSDYFNREHVSRPYGQYFGFTRFECSDTKARDLLCFAVLNRHVHVFEFLLPHEPFDEIRIHKELLAALKKSDERFAILFINRLFPNASEAYKKLFVALLLDSEAGIRESLNSHEQFVYGSENQVYRPLHAAVLLRSGIGVRLILGRGCPIDILNVEKHTVLSYAIELGYSDIVRELLQAKADANGFTPNGIPLPYVALYNDDADIFRELLKCGAHANMKDERGSALLHEVAVKADTVCMRILLERDANVNICDRYGYRPLHVVIGDQIGEESLAAVRLLLQNGADVNARVTSGAYAGATALSFALESISKHIDKANDVDDNEVKHHVELVRELLLWGAHIRQEEMAVLRKIFKKKPLLSALLCETPLDVAECNDSREVLNEVLEFAIARQNSDYTDLLISYGAEARVGFKVLDEILHRRHLTPEAKTLYEKIRATINRRITLWGSTIRSANSSEEMRRPLVSQTPQELERLLCAILLSRFDQAQQ